MQRKEQVTKTVTREEVVETTCDICGSDSRTWKDAFMAGEFGAEASSEHHGPLGYVQSMVQLSASLGWPEAITSRGWEYDVCPSCFLTKLIPWIRSQRGVGPREQNEML